MFENVSVKKALRLSLEGKAVLLDIRTEEAYKKGHLPGARHVTDESIERELADKRMMKILYCDYGNLSMRLAKAYSEQGYENLASIVGGYHAYEGFIELKKGSIWTMEWKNREGKE